MSTAGLKGVNAVGHKGWVSVRCKICGRYLDLTMDIVYACPYCRDRYGAYFCAADAKRLHYRCPYCGRQLEPITPWLRQQQPTGRGRR